MATAIFQSKSDAEMLAALQVYYPQISAFHWNGDGTATITSPDPLSDGEKQDLVQYISGPASCKIV